MPFETFDADVRDDTEKKDYLWTGVYQGRELKQRRLDRR
jgi:hypothetical protein